MSFELNPLIESEIYYEIIEGVINVYHKSEDEILGKVKFPVVLNSRNKTTSEIEGIARKYEFSIEDEVIKVLDLAVYEEGKYNLIISEEDITYFDYTTEKWVTAERKGVFEWIACQFENKKEPLDKTGQSSKDYQEIEEYTEVRDDFSEVTSISQYNEDQLEELEVVEVNTTEENYNVIDTRNEDKEQSYEEIEAEENGQVVKEEDCLEENSAVEIQMPVEKDTSVDTSKVDKTTVVAKEGTIKKQQNVVQQPQVITKKEVREVPALWEKNYMRYMENRHKEVEDVTLEDLVDQTVLLILEYKKDVFEVDRKDLMSKMFDSVEGLFDSNIVLYAALYTVYDMQCK